MRTPRRIRVNGTLALIAVMALGTAACGADTPAASGCDVAVSSDVSSKPVVTVPGCAAPVQAQTKDIVAGTGKAAVEGDALKVKYVGLAWSSRDEFGASWGPADAPLEVAPLGRAGVIDGWNQGLVGVKVGGRRLLVIPPNLGYGAQGKGPIKANETLVFVVDVVSIN